MNSKKMKNELTIIIGKRISEIRKSLNLTQEDVEARSIINGEKTIKYKTLSLIEQGYGEPKITTLYLIAQALGVELCDLLNVKIVNYKMSTNQEIIDNIITILKTFDRLKLNIVLKQIDAIKNVN